MIIFLTVFDSQEKNVLEAAATGVSESLPLVANIAANLIAFLAMLAFVNAVASWFGSMVGHPEWTFQVSTSTVQGSTLSTVL